MRSRLCPRLTHLIEEPLGKGLEALGAHEAGLMVQLTIAVHNLLSRCKATLAALTGSAGQGIGHVAAMQKDSRLEVVSSVT